MVITSKVERLVTHDTASSSVDGTGDLVMSLSDSSSLSSRSCSFSCYVEDMTYYTSSTESNSRTNDKHRLNVYDRSYSYSASMVGE